MGAEVLHGAVEKQMVCVDSCGCNRDRKSALLHEDTVVEHRSYSQATFAAGLKLEFVVLALSPLCARHRFTDRFTKDNNSALMNLIAADHTARGVGLPSVLSKVAGLTRV